VQTLSNGGSAEHSGDAGSLIVGSDEGGLTNRYVGQSILLSAVNHMGLLVKTKSAASAVTGGGAKVSIEFPHQPIRSGDSMQAKVTAMSTGKEVKSGGVFVDVEAHETGQVKCQRCQQMVPIRAQTVRQTIPIGPALVLQPGETKTLEATIQVPPGQPTYNGNVRHEWEIRGRLDAFGNDPDSGFQLLEVTR